MWLGKWNSAKDREPNRKEEDLFKEFLCTKYERRQWYKSPTQVRKDEASKSEVVKTETKLLPPPSSKVSFKRAHPISGFCYSLVF